MALYLSDIDGTVAIMGGGRGPFDWARVGEDLPNVPVIRVLQALNRVGHTIIFISGRMAQCCELTNRWLEQNIGNWAEITAYHMRADGDFRPDQIVKREIHDRIVEEFGEPVMGVFDDRDKVVRMWRDMEITCFQVADGHF